MFWQDKVLIGIACLLGIIVALYCIYRFLSLFVSVEYLEIEEPITTEEFKKQYATKPVELNLSDTKEREPLDKKFKRLQKKGILSPEADFLEWVKTQPGTGELLTTPLELTPNSQLVK